MGFEKTAAVIIGLALAAAVNAATLLITEPLTEGEYTLVPVVPPPVDSDTDGVPDDVDDCPDEYGTEPDGCPLPQVDTDGDGLADDVDACPTIPAQTPDGCPLPPPDADGDGVPDDIDQCADTPAGDTVDSVGCTVVPTDPGDLAATPIGQLAATVPPGETRLLPGSPAVQGYREDGTPAPQTDEWTSSAYWYPATNTSWFMGLRVSHRFISYDAETDTWREFNLDGVENAVPRFPGPGHAYERGALDAGRGHFYYLNAGVLHRYVIAEDRWEKFENTGMEGQVIEWNDGIDMLVNNKQTHLIGFRDGQVFSLPDTPVYGYHSSLRYNKVRGDMLMMGGNYSLSKVAILKSDGTVEQKSDAPFTFTISSDDLTYDPATGNYLVTTDWTLWEYNPDLDEWREAGWANGYPLNNYGRQVPIVIEELGIIAWQTLKGLTLYRHQSAFTQEEMDAAKDVFIPPLPEVVEPSDPPPGVVEPPVSGTENLLADQAATMEPGEWRKIADLTSWPGKSEGLNFGDFATVDVLDSESSYPVTGMGWTQDLIYHDGALMMMLMRSDGRECVLLHMDKQGEFSRITQPFVGSRRPYNKIASDGEYFYWMTPSRDFEVPGMARTPLDAPGILEPYSPNFKDSQIEPMSALTYVPEWGRFYAYTPGGKLWTWTHGEPAWTRLDKLDSHLSGYAGVLLWNPVKKELIIAGGQTFGGADPVAHHIARLTEPMGKMEILPDMLKPDGEPLYYTAASGRMIVDPRDGSYLFNIGKMIYSNETAGGQYSDYLDLSTVGSPFGNYENYNPYAFIPGTDVIVFLSHVSGVVLFRLNEIDGA